jgi:predicted nucleic acid-binding Zn ribbon protein
MASWLARERQRMEGEKFCSKCGDLLPLEKFPRNRGMHLGVSSRCRECHREATRDWRERNRDEINAERRAEYREQHPLPEKRCVVCGGPMQKRPDAIVCSPECRRARQNEQRRESHRRAAASIDF